MNTYQQSYWRQYLTKGGTFQHLFCILIWYLILALPFYFSFGGQSNFCNNKDFWLQPNTDMMNLQYNYTGYYAIQVNYIESNTYHSEQYSNIIGSTINTLAGLQSFQVTDVIDSSEISFALGSYGAKDVLNVNLILYYKVWVEELDKEISASYVENINGNMAYAEMRGVLRYQPEAELNSIDTNKFLNYPTYLPDLKPPTSFDSLITYIIENHSVHRLTHEVITQSATSQQSYTRQFSIKLIKDTKVNISYYPSVLETLKFAFSTWLAFVIIASFVFYQLLGKLCKDGALVVKVKDQVVA